MALHSIEVREGKILVDNGLFGDIATVPPRDVSCVVSAQTVDNLAEVRIRWNALKSPSATYPLEIFRLRSERFYPKAALVAGRTYGLSGTSPSPEGKLGFPYNTYYKFRMFPPPPYDAALYAKLPVACWEEKDRAFAVGFPKFLNLPHCCLPVFIRSSGAAASLDFSAAILNDIKVDRKPFGWFGGRVRHERQSFSFSEGQSLEAAFLLASADTWVECINALAAHLHQSEEGADLPSADTIAAELKKAIRFYDRVWDERNRTHVHLPIKNVPGFESVEIEHSHITDDLSKLVLYHRLAQLGFTRLAQRERKLLQRLTMGDYCYERNGSRLWHTTTYFKGNGLKACTHHGIGFVGFPGGMATVVRHLFEYCSLASSPYLEEGARAGADWLIRTQSEDGSWPAVAEKSKNPTGRGCVASTAESARALMAAYRRTEKREYLRAAEAAIKFVNRKESFFECKQYLRHVDPNEHDGITAETCIHANLDRLSCENDIQAIEQAGKWGFYALQWIRPRLDDHQQAHGAGGPAFDGLSHSITPRIDVWGGLLIARAFMRLSRMSGEEMWGNHAWRLFQNITALRERDGGLCETWFLDFPSGLESIHIEPTFTADALIEFILEACRDEKESPPADAVFGGAASPGNKLPPLQSSARAQNFVVISKDLPEFIIGRNLRFSLSFDGVYGFFERVRQAVYTALRRLPIGRGLLKIVPTAKIIFNLHGPRLPISRIGKADRIPVKSVSAERNKGGRQRHVYQTPYHQIVFSVLSAGTNADKNPCADLGIGVKTIAGDVTANQVRIDLNGQYEIKSIRDKDQIVISSAGNEYSILLVDSAIDEIITDGARLSFDISLSSNWNFFGTYSLRLRVENRGKQMSHQSQPEQWNPSY